MNGVCGKFNLILTSTFTFLMKVILKLFIVLSSLLFLDILMYYYFFISFAGYYSDIILFWLWFICTVMVIVTYWKKLVAKLFLTSIFLVIILSIVPMMIPFYGFLLSMTPFGLIKNQNLNKNYRAQIVGYSVMVPPSLEIIKKMGLLEKRTFRLENKELEDLNSALRISSAKAIFFRSETVNTLSIELFYGGPNIFITFDKKTGKVSESKNLNTN